MTDLDRWLFLLLNAGPDTPHVVVVVFRFMTDDALALVALGTFALSLLQRRHRLAVLAALAAMLAAAAAVALIRSALPLPRPAALGLGVQWLAQNAGRPGFPSAHTTAAFAFATALLLARWQRAASIAFLAAGMVGYSRVFLGAHFPSQVLAGALLGTALALALLSLRAAISRRIAKLEPPWQGQDRGFRLNASAARAPAWLLRAGLPRVQQLRSFSQHGSPPARKQANHL